MPRFARLEKRLQILPGTMVWLMFIGLAGFSYWRPSWVAYVLLMYALYWLFRSTIFLVRILIVFFLVVKDTQHDWKAEYEALDRGPVARLAALEQALSRWRAEQGRKFLGLPTTHPLSHAWTLVRLYAREQSALRAYVQLRQSIDQIKSYLRSGESLRSEQVNHVVVIPTYKEGMPILGPTFDHLLASNFPLERVHVVVAGEAADNTFALTQAALIKQYGSRVPHLHFHTHTLTLGEVVGKSSNQASATKWFVKEVFPALGIQAEHVLVTSLDADYRVHEGYFSYLTYRYVVDPGRAYHLFQPIPMFFNNIWKVNAFSRLRATMDTQIQMARQLDYQENRNFSSYALALSTLIKADYWDVDVIQEDSRLFWKVYFSHGARVRVEPLFLPVYGDAVRSSTYFKTLVSLYEQLRRWAWGASDVPYVIVNCLRHREISWLHRVRAVITVITNYFNWATMPVILALGSMFPLAFNKGFSQTVLGTNLPVFTSNLLTLTFIVVIVFLIIDAMLAPAKPKEWSLWRKTSLYMYWLTLPVFGIIFGALPAVDAQTRLLLGKQLEYKVTEKQQ